MAARVKKMDKYARQILDLLHDRYVSDHPKAQVEAYRYNEACVRVRIIDPDFAKQDWVDREETVWKILEELPEEVLADLSMLLLITPKERKESLSGMEFDDPAPKRP